MLLVVKLSHCVSIPSFLTRVITFLESVAIKSDVFPTL